MLFEEGIVRIEADFKNVVTLTKAILEQDGL